ncbi:MAG: class I SAM-dependent methyltransferase [Sterolibacterium sp.]|nr:class I SAM-dependent methyltransferase [Sterolibacterium sp.]
MFSSPTPLRAALLAQILGGIAAAVIIQLAYPQLFTVALAGAALQGVCAALIGHWLGAPKWWLPIHCLFMPAVVLASRLNIDSNWYLAALLLLLLIFWRTDQSRVPLYLSNAATARALKTMLPAAPCLVIDLGCAHGGLLRRLARARPDCRFVGIEHAPLPWLWAKLASLTLPNLQIRYGDFWRQNLASFDVVYAFLSPVPMPRLMEKALAEMRPGTLLVSNSFAVPAVTAERVVELADRRATRLHCYRM